MKRWRGRLKPTYQGNATPETVTGHQGGSTQLGRGWGSPYFCSDRKDKHVDEVGLTEEENLTPDTPVPGQELVSPLAVV